MTAPVHIPRGQQYFCLDCEAVTNLSHICPSCASLALVALAKWLNREVEEVTC